MDQVVQETGLCPLAMGDAVFDREVTQVNGYIQARAVNDHCCEQAYLDLPR